MLITSKPCSTAQRRPASRTGPLPVKPGAEHAHAVQLAVRRERADDPGAGGAVPAEVALVSSSTTASRRRRRDDGDRAVDAADERVAGLDAAVEDADAHARAGRAAPAPTRA